MLDWQKFSPKKQFWLGTAIIAVVTLLVYLPAFRAGFIWDDDIVLTANRLIQSPDGWWRMWMTKDQTFYFPITWLSFWLEWRLWGMNATGYHVTNVLLHILGAVLVWRILDRLRVPGAWLGGLLFAVHPVNVESVAWIAERKNTLSLVLAAAATLKFLDFETTGRRRDYALTLGLFVLALLSKSAVVMLPIAFWLCAWWQRGALTRRDVIRMVPFFAVALVIGLVTLWFQNHKPTTGGSGLYFPAPSALQRLLGAGWTWWFYLLKTVWPLNLMTLYPVPAINVQSVIWYVPIATMVAGLAVLAWQSHRRWVKPVWFALAYFTVMLFPIWGVAVAKVWGGPVLADHLQYYSLVGITALAAAALHRQRLLAAGLTIALGVLTWQQCQHYHNPETLWREAIRRNPQSATARYNLGAHLMEARRFEEARALFQETIGLRRRHARAHMNSALCDAALGNTAAALKQLQTAITLQPKWPELHDNIGTTLLALGRKDDAIAAFRKAAKLKPTATRHYKLGLLLHSLNRDAEAIAEFQRTVELDPAKANAHFNLGLLRLRQGELGPARQHLREAARLDPRDPAARQLLAELERLPQ